MRIGCAWFLWCVGGSPTPGGMYAAPTAPLHVACCFALRLSASRRPYSAAARSMPFRVETVGELPPLQRRCT